MHVRLQLQRLPSRNVCKVLHDHRVLVCLMQSKLQEEVVVLFDLLHKKYEKLVLHQKNDLLTFRHIRVQKERLVPHIGR